MGVGLFRRSLDRGEGGGAHLFTIACGGSSNISELEVHAWSYNTDQQELRPLGRMVLRVIIQWLRLGLGTRLLKESITAKYIFWLDFPNFARFLCSAWAMFKVLVPIKVCYLYVRIFFRSRSN